MQIDEPLFDHLLADELRGETADGAQQLVRRVERVLQNAAATTDDHATAPPTRAAARQRRLAVVVAAAAVCVVGVLWLAGGDGRAHSPIWHGTGDAVFVAGTSMPRDSVLWATSPVLLTLPTAQRWRVDAGGVAQRAADGSLKLLAGRWQLDCAGTAVLTIGPGRLELAAASSVAIELAPLTFELDPTTMNAPRLLARLREHGAAFSVTLTLLAGSGELLLGQERTSLRTQQPQPVQDATAKAIAARARTLYAAVRKDLPAPDTEAGMLAWKDMVEQQTDLRRLVLQEPAARQAIRADLLQDLGGRGNDDTVQRLLHLALVDEEPKVWLGLVDAFERRRAAFDFEAQVGMAERGFAPAQALLRDYLREDHGTLDARAAAALQFGKDAQAAATLAKWSATGVDDALADFQRFDALCMARVAQGSAGDRDAVTRLRGELTAGIGGLLAKGTPQDIAEAASWVRRASYFLASERPRVSLLHARLDAHRGPDLGTGLDAALVRSALATLQR